MTTATARRRKEKELLANRHFDLISFLFNHKVSLKDFVEDFNSKFGDVCGVVAYSKFRYRLHTNTLTQEQLANAEELVKILKKELK